MILAPSVNNHSPLDLREAVNLKKFTLKFKSFIGLMFFIMVGWGGVVQMVYCSKNGQSDSAVVEVSDVDDPELQKLKTMLNEIIDGLKAKDKDETLIYQLEKIKKYTYKIFFNIQKTQIKKIFIESVIGLMNIIGKEDYKANLKDNLDNFERFLYYFNELLMKISGQKEELIKSVIKLMNAIGKNEDSLKDNINNFRWLLWTFNELLKDDAITKPNQKQDFIKSVIGLMKIIQQEQHKNNLKDNIDNFRWLLYEFHELLKHNSIKDSGYKDQLIKSVIGLMKIIGDENHKNNLKDNINNFRWLLKNFNDLLRDESIKDSANIFIDSVIGLINRIGKDTDSLKDNIDKFERLLWNFNELLNNQLIEDTNQKQQLIESVIGLMNKVGDSSTRQDLKNNIYYFICFLHRLNSLLRDGSRINPHQKFIESVCFLMDDIRKIQNGKEFLKKLYEAAFDMDNIEKNPKTIEAFVKKIDSIKKEEIQRERKLFEGGAGGSAGGSPTGYPGGAYRGIPVSTTDSSKLGYSAPTSTTKATTSKGGSGARGPSSGTGGGSAIGTGGGGGDAGSGTAGSGDGRLPTRSSAREAHHQVPESDRQEE